jgi:hypothetical protein
MARIILYPGADHLFGFARWLGVKPSKLARCFRFYGVPVPAG